MKKLTLRLDALHVESFELSHAERSERGTIKAHDYTNDLNCWTNADGGLSTSPSCLRTCDYSCETCGFSCNGTCGEGTCYGDTCICWPPA